MLPRISVLLAIAVASAAMWGCSDDSCPDCPEDIDTIHVYMPPDTIIVHDTTEIELDLPPQPPQGVFSVTGDGAVELWWAGPYEHDIDQYRIYRATSPDDIEPNTYQFLFAVDATINPNLDLLWYSALDDSPENGTTYWYAIASVDFAGQVSDLSAEMVFDTPRPEGVVLLSDAAISLATSGFDFGTRTRVSADNVTADVYVDSFEGILYLNAGNTGGTHLTDIQDMGFTDFWDVIGYAPTDGWSELGFSEIILGHTYIIWTDDEHFAKMRVMDINLDGTVAFQWAWQPQVNNPELTAPNGGAGD